MCGVGAATLGAEAIRPLCKAGFDNTTTPMGSNPLASSYGCGDF